MLSRRALLGAGASTALAASTALLTSSPTTKAWGSSAWGQLGSGLEGDLVLPGDGGYDRARQLVSAQWDHIHPRAVAYCESERDVRTCVQFAQDRGIHTAIRSGGHNFNGWSTTEGLVINLTRMNRVRAGASTVRVGPAAQAVDIVSKLTPHGLTVPGGFCPTVCSGGFVTGGGHGWQHRKYGPACDRLVSARVVLADGRIVTASETENSDLLWALRGGGGGNFGVITDFELAPTRIPSVGTFTVTWPWDKAQRVLTAYQDWARNAAPELAPDAVLLLDDAKPGAVPTVLVTGAYLGPVGELEASLKELSGLVGSAPATRTVQEMTYEKAMMQVFGCGDKSVEQCHITGANPRGVLPRTVNTRNRGRMFERPIPSAGIDDLLSAFDAQRRAGQQRFLSLMALGKNANRLDPDATAYVHRDSEFTAVWSVDLKEAVPAPEEREAAQSWVDGCFAAVDPHSNGHSYVNYPDLQLSDWASSYYGQNLPRLTSVKRRYDPHDFFRFPHSIKI